MLLIVGDAVVVVVVIDDLVKDGSDLRSGSFAGAKARVEADSYAWYKHNYIVMPTTCISLISRSSLQNVKI